MRYLVQSKYLICKIRGTQRMWADQRKYKKNGNDLLLYHKRMMHRIAMRIDVLHVAGSSILHCLQLL